MPYTGRPGVDWGSVAQMLNLERQITETQQQQKIQAMQWQGQQDYQTLVDSGIEPREALKRTAPKLFYSDPRGMANAIAASQSTYGPNSEPVVKTLPDGKTQVLWTGNSYQVLKPEAPPPGEYTAVTTTDPTTGNKETRKVLTSELEAQKKQSELETAATQYQSAQKELQTWKHPFGWGATPYKEQMAGASNVLASAGIDPRTMQPFQTNIPPASPIPAAAPSGPPAAPKNKTDRIPGQQYTTPDNKQLWWNGREWTTEKPPVNKYSHLPIDVRGNAGTRG